MRPANPFENNLRPQLKKDWPPFFLFYRKSLVLDPSSCDWVMTQLLSRRGGGGRVIPHFISIPSHCIDHVSSNN